MNKEHLPGIKSIGYCQAKKLQPDILDIYNENDRMKIYGTIINIPIIGLGSINVTSEIVKGVTIYKVNAAFQICGTDEFSKNISTILKKNIHSFVLETVNNEKLLIGTHEKPYPVVSVSYDNSNSPTGSRGYFVEVKYQNTHSYIILE